MSTRCSSTKFYSLWECASRFFEDWFLCDWIPAFILKETYFGGPKHAEHSNRIWLAYANSQRSGWLFSSDDSWQIPMILPVFPGPKCQVKLPLAALAARFILKKECRCKIFPALRLLGSVKSNMMIFLEMSPCHCDCGTLLFISARLTGILDRNGSQCWWSVVPAHALRQGAPGRTMPEEYPPKSARHVYVFLLLMYVDVSSATWFIEVHHATFCQVSGDSPQQNTVLSTRSWNPKHSYLRLWQ